MGQQDNASASQFGHRLAEVVLFHMHELIYSRGREKAFETETAGLEKRRELAHIAGYDAAPESHIDPASALGGPDFRFVSQNGSSGGNAVQRHFDQGGYATGRGRPRSCVKTFPLGAARLVDVYVRIH